MSRNSNGNASRNTVIFILLGSLLGWLIYFNDFTLGDLGNFLPMSDQMASMSLDLLLVPFLVALTVFYLASLVGVFFEGPLAEVLVGTLYAVAFAAFFSLFLILNPAPKINQAGYLLSGAFGVVLVYNLIATVARMRKQPGLKAVAISATIYAEGQIAIRIISLLIASSGAGEPSGLIQAVGQFINLGVSIAAVFTLFAVFKDSENAYLSSFGGLASNYLVSVSISLISGLYYGFFLGGLAKLAPGISQLTPYVEWTGICIFAALLFTVMRRGMQKSIMVRNRLGDWRKHLQQVTTYKGDRFVGFTEMIEEFVTHGNKDRLLVKLALFLNENQVSDEEISELLGDLIKYQDEGKPDISRRGRALVIDNQNMENRLAILQRTISRMVPTGIGGIPAPGGVEVDAAQAASDSQ